MQELFWILGEFIVMLLTCQIIFFELNLRNIKKSNNMLWYLSLDKHFSYNRSGYMAFLCFICYMLFTDLKIFSIEWFLYFILFLAVGIISDAIVQFLILKYGQLRCKKQINEAKDLQEEVLKLKNSEVFVEDYEQLDKKINEEEILKRYLKPEDHLAFLSIDQGKFASSFQALPEVTYDVEPYGDISEIQEKMHDLPIKVTTLTQSHQMPFKDDKIDIIMNQLCNYDKHEIKRVLKPSGYFVLHQNGTGNYKELIDMYMRIPLRGEWKLESCIPTLESIGFKIIEKIEDYNSIQFYSIEGLYSYFKKISLDFCDVEKYIAFYMVALKQIKEQGFYKLSTYDFLIVAKNEM